ncbi:MAG: hypothetical protein V4474_00945 [Patescibacteria group bacterium]
MRLGALLLMLCLFVAPAAAEGRDYCGADRLAPLDIGLQRDKESRVVISRFCTKIPIEFVSLLRSAGLAADKWQSDLKNEGVDIHDVYRLGIIVDNDSPHPLKVSVQALYAREFGESAFAQMGATAISLEPCQRVLKTFLAPGRPVLSKVQLNISKVRAANQQPERLHSGVAEVLIPDKWQVMSFLEKENSLTIPKDIAKSPNCQK